MHGMSSQRRVNGRAPVLLHGPAALALAVPELPMIAVPELDLRYSVSKSVEIGGGHMVVFESCH